MSLWAEMLGAEVRFYTTRSGVKTRCIRMGDGAPLVLLTGMTGHAEMWLKNLHSLSRHLDVYAVDMPGHGLTDAPRVKYEIPDFADDVLQFHVARQAPKLIPDSTFELVKNCAHWPRLEKPELFHQIVGDFPAA